MPHKRTARKAKPYSREVHIHDGVSIEPYETGEIEGGVRAWNEAHEQLMSDFYDGRLLWMTQSELNGHLDEAGFVARERGKGVVAADAISLASLIHCPDFDKRFVNPFKAMSIKEREEVLLKALSERERLDGAESSYVRDWQRELVPEITLDQLCADDGEGLSSLFSSLSQCLLEEDLVNSPILHPDVFRKLGIEGGSNRLPFAANLRAFCEDMILIRTSIVAQGL